ncbi:hypothetical protein PSTT_03877 [Puccinia striiformis]|uniref:DUF659 domain-containing protein n=1 Tax=Puccinia striiformis TaxID=27350 RepID=A0A2S4VUK2_9BASI|nr:hypothetical protein PSTT_03877 [Puccinia striiformis]
MAPGTRLRIPGTCRCGHEINRPRYDSSPSNLSKHVAGCKKDEASKNQKLTSMGISGTGDVDARDVPQLCAIWDHAPDCGAKLTHTKAVSNDIGRLYTAMQETFIESLKDHRGGMYLGLDAWQSPNGFDILGTVIYRLVKDETTGFDLEAIPLDFVTLNQSHTGVYLAETVRTIVEKFNLQDKICGIVTDNASNNGTMIEELASFHWPRFKGQPQWIRCFAHILNLIVQVILRPFGSHKKNPANSANANDSDDNDSDQEDSEDPDDQIQL